MDGNSRINGGWMAIGMGGGMHGRMEEEMDGGWMEDGCRMDGEWTARMKSSGEEFVPTFEAMSQQMGGPRISQKNLEAALHDDEGSVGEEG